MLCNLITLFSILLLLPSPTALPALLPTSNGRLSPSLSLLLLPSPAIQPSSLALNIQPVCQSIIPAAEFRHLVAQLFDIATLNHRSCPGLLLLSLLYNLIFLLHFFLSCDDFILLLLSILLLLLLL